MDIQTRREWLRLFGIVVNEILEAIYDERKKETPFSREAVNWASLRGQVRYCICADATDDFCEIILDEVSPGERELSDQLEEELIKRDTIIFKFAANGEKAIMKNQKSFHEGAKGGTNESKQPERSL